MNKNNVPIIDKRFVYGDFLGVDLGARCNDNYILIVKLKNAANVWIVIDPPASNAFNIYMTMIQFNEYPITYINAIINNYNGPTLPITAPNETTTAVIAYSAVI